LADTLLQLLLERLAHVAAPLVLHREIAVFPSQEADALISAGILRETSKATEVPRPANLPPGDDLIVQETSHGLFGVAQDDDYFPPVPLTEDDRRQYEIVVLKFVERIRRANKLQGAQHQEGQRLFALGQRRQADGSKAEVYLSLLNRDEPDVCDVARRLRAAQHTPTVLLLPIPIPLSTTGRQALTEMQTSVFALSDSLDPDKWTLPWEELVIAATDRRRTPTTAIQKPLPTLEKLILERLKRRKDLSATAMALHMMKLKWPKTGKPYSLRGIKEALRRLKQKRLIRKAEKGKGYTFVKCT
jgi:hypothetical protein